MNKFSIMKLANTIVRYVSKPVGIFFGSDERGFMTLLLLCMVSYWQGFPDAATIFAVYSAMFGFSGMLNYKDLGGSDSKDDEKLEDIEGMMNDALSMAEQFQEEQDEVKQQ